MPGITQRSSSSLSILVKISILYMKKKKTNLQKFNKPMATQQ